MKPNPYFLLTYEVVDDYVNARAPYRKAHLELITEYADRGLVLLAGALADPADGAVIVFQAPDARVVDEFARKDPYVRAGVVTGWTIRSWTVVAGSKCESPVRPETLK